MKVIISVILIVTIVYLMCSAVAASFSIPEWHIALRVVFAGWSLIAIYRYAKNEVNKPK